VSEEETLGRMRCTICLLVLILVSGCTPDVEMIDPWGPPAVPVEPWNPQTRVFQWSEGSIQLPEGYSYRRGWGTDSFIGQFESADGLIVLRHDIFGCIEDESPSRPEQSPKGCRAIYPGQKGSRLDNPRDGVFEARLQCGSSSFFVLRSADLASLDVLEQIVQSYRPTDRSEPSGPH